MFKHHGIELRIIVFKVQDFYSYLDARYIYTFTFLPVLWKFIL